jgi:hypothetical protein
MYNPRSLAIGPYIGEYELLYEELGLTGLKLAFPDVLSPAERAELGAVAQPDNKLPIDRFAATLNGPTPVGAITAAVIRCLTPRQTIVGMPFHLFLHDWERCVAQFPPFDVQNAAFFIDGASDIIFQSAATVKPGSLVFAQRERFVRDMALYIGSIGHYDTAILAEIASQTAFRERFAFSLDAASLGRIASHTVFGERVGSSVLPEIASAGDPGAPSGDAELDGAAQLVRPA